MMTSRTPLEQFCHQYPSSEFNQQKKFFCESFFWKGVKIQDKIFDRVSPNKIYSYHLPNLYSFWVHTNLYSPGQRNKSSPDSFWLLNALKSQFSCPMSNGEDIFLENRQKHQIRHIPGPEASPGRGESWKNPSSIASPDWAQPVPAGIMIKLSCYIGEEKAKERPKKGWKIWGPAKTQQDR